MGLGTGVHAASDDRFLTRCDRYRGRCVANLVNRSYRADELTDHRRPAVMREFDAVQGIIVATLIGIAIWLLIAIGLFG